jgi:hypothetical protein
MTPGNGLFKQNRCMPYTAQLHNNERADPLEEQKNRRTFIRVGATSAQNTTCTQEATHTTW